MKILIAALLVALALTLFGVTPNPAQACVPTNAPAASFGCQPAPVGLASTDYMPVWQPSLFPGSLRLATLAQVGAIIGGSLTVGTSPIATGTSHGLLFNNGAILGNLAAATNGQIPIGSTGAAPVLATITAGAGATVTNGPASITIAATGSAPVDVAPVYNVVLGYNAKCDGSTNDTSAFQAAITAIHNSGAPGILYIPPPTSAGTTAGYGCMVTGGVLGISDNLVTIRGAGGMGGLNNGSGTGLGPSTITNVGGGSTFVISGNGDTVQDLSFNADGAQTGEYIDITGLQDTVKNVHAQDPNIGIYIANTGDTFISDFLEEGTIGTGGIYINTTSTAYLHHVIMFSVGTQPAWGIKVDESGELFIDSGTDIDNMGTSLLIDPGNGQFAVATHVSDSFFDTGNSGANIAVVPTGSGFVLTMRFSNVWTSTGITGGSQLANGWEFDARGTLSGLGITDVQIVNGLGQGFVGHDGLYINGPVTDISVNNSTFGNNRIGVEVGANVNNFNIINSWMGNYTGAGANSYYGLVVDAGTSDYYTITGNHIVGNGTGQLSDGGSGTNKIVTCNIGVSSNVCGSGSVSGITALTGDVTASGSGSVAATLATVNSGPGSVGSSTAIPVLTTNGKGLVTSQTTAAVVAPAGTLTGTTLAGNVTTSSLTHVGALVSGSIGSGFTAIANSALANDATTVNGQSCLLGSSCTVTASAATLGGTTLNSTVVSSSLTSVGTLASLTATGNITSSSGSIVLDSATAVVAGGADSFNLVAGGGTGNHYVVIGTQGGGSANALGVLTTGTLAPIANNAQGFGTASSTWLSIYGETYFAGASGASAGVACSGSPTSSFASVGGIVTHC